MHCPKRLFVIINSVIIIATTAISVYAQSKSTWDNQSEFALDKNPNGAWVYGCLDKENQFVPYDSTFDLGDGIIGWCMNDDPDSSGNITINISDKTVVKHGVSWEPGQICLHPGLFGCKAVLRWTSPVTASLNMRIGIGAKSKNGAPTNIEILQRGNRLSQTAMCGFAGISRNKSGRFGANPEISYQPSVLVKKGDTVDIVVSDTGKSVTGHVALSLSIFANRVVDSIPADPDTDKLLQSYWIAQTNVTSLLDLNNTYGFDTKSVLTLLR
ncbi:hypothetical protein LLG46_12150 [bacterium]|nr:hypothetical protein [bacterium]